MNIPEQTPETRQRILIVDDSKVIRLALKKLLSTDYDVVAAQNGEEAWALLAADPSIQVVFTDLNMPVLDGFGLLQRIRKSPEKRVSEVPVIILTGKEDVDSAKDDVLAKGANDFLAKPFDPAQVKARVTSYLRLKQTTEQLDETSERLEKEAAEDPLTGLGSARYFRLAANEALAQLKRHGGNCVCMYLSIDNHASIVQQFGKPVANAVLKAVGRKLAGTARAEDKVARVGDNLFALLLIATDLDGASGLAERIKANIAALKFNINGEAFHAAESIGLYEPRLDAGISLEEIEKQTRACLDSAIEQGQNSIVAVSYNSQPRPVEAVEPVCEITVAEALEKVANGRSEELADVRENLLVQLLPLLEHVINDQAMLVRLVTALKQKGIKLS